MTPNNGLSELKLKMYKRKTKCSCSTSRININKTENCWWQRKGTKARNSLKRMIGSTLEFEYWIRFFGCANSGSRTWELPFVSKKRESHIHTLFIWSVASCYASDMSCDISKHFSNINGYTSISFNTINDMIQYDSFQYAHLLLLSCGHFR